VEPRFIILAAAVGIFFFALTAFVSSLVRTARAHSESEPVQELGEWPALPAVPEGGVDIDLQGLETPVASDAPSASLLTPLRVGTWQPSAEPAPSSRLNEVSLAERIATYLPPTPAPEPELRPTTQATAEPVSAPTPQPAPAPTPEAAPAPTPKAAPAPEPTPVQVPQPIAPVEVGVDSAYESEATPSIPQRIPEGRAAIPQQQAVADPHLERVVPTVIPVPPVDEWTRPAGERADAPMPESPTDMRVPVTSGPDAGPAFEWVDDAGSSSQPPRVDTGMPLVVESASPAPVVQAASAQEQGAVQQPEPPPVLEPEPVSVPIAQPAPCLLYTSPSPRDRPRSRMPSSA
jgi:hypothetical protein